MAPYKKPTQAAQLVDFGDPESDVYSQSFDLPEGDYVWSDIDVRMWSGFNAEKSQNATPRLGVMITVVPLKQPDAEPRMVFYSMGTKAAESFAPDPDTGTGIIATGQGTGKLPPNTNWIILIKSLLSAGLPKGIFTNDVSVFKGLHAHMALVPEPAERGSYKAATGEAPEQEEKKYARSISIVTEILDGGKPWEGTSAARKPNGAPKPTIVKSVAKVNQPEPVAEAEDEDVKTAAMGSFAEVISKNPPNKPLTKAMFRVNVSKEVIKTYSDQDMVDAVASTYLDNEEALGALLGELGYHVAGLMIKPL